MLDILTVVGVGVVVARDVFLIVVGVWLFIFLFDRMDRTSRQSAWIFSTVAIGLYLMGQFFEVREYLTLLG